jgi:hypothetical protein
MRLEQRRMAGLGVHLGVERTGTIYNQLFLVRNA